MQIPIANVLEGMQISDCGDGALAASENGSRRLAFLCPNMEAKLTSSSLVQALVPDRTIDFLMELNFQATGGNVESWFVPMSMRCTLKKLAWVRSYSATGTCQTAVVLSYIWGVGSDY